VSPARRRAGAGRRGDGAESRERLLEAATALVAERGVAGAPVGEICDRAGVARTALYWHFGSKEGLVAAVVETAGTRFIERIRKRVYLEGDPFQRIDRLIEEWRDILTTSPELIRVPMMAQLEHGDDDRTPLGRAVRAVRERAERALVEGMVDTLGPVLEAPERVAQILVALLQGAAVRQVAEPRARLGPFFDELRRTILVVIASRLTREGRAELERRVGRGATPPGDAS